MRKLLVLDTSFTFEMIRERGLEESVTCRNLGGFFDHVWTAHPFATLLTSEGWTPRYGKPVAWEVTPSSTFIEGKVGRFAALRWAFPLNFLLAQVGLFFWLRRLIRKEGIGVVRAGDPLYLGLLGWMLARTTGAALVVRVGQNHDKAFETTGRPMEPRLMRSRKVEKAVERFVFPRADLVAGANQDNLNFALANGARAERSTLFRYGNLIDKRHFVPPEQRQLGKAVLAELGLEPKRFVIYVGRLIALKHPDDVIRVVAKAREAGHDVRGVLVGDGPMRDELVALARELGVADDIVFAGNRSQPWLAEVLPQAALVVSPHTGRALTEAALAAVPIVAYDIDWQGELIVDGLTGALVPHRELSRMAEAACHLLSDKERASAVGQAVRAKALEMLDPAALDEHERRQYSLLLATRERGSGQASA